MQDLPIFGHKPGGSLAGSVVRQAAVTFTAAETEYIRPLTGTKLYRSRVTEAHVFV